MIKTINDIIELAKKGETRRVAVANAADLEVLKAVAEARKLGIANGVLTGDKAVIEGMLKELGEDPADYEFIEADGEEAAAQAAAATIKEGKADFVMKGSMQTGTVMKAVLNKENDLRTGRALSHCMLLEPAGLGRLLLDTDGGMNTFPTLEQKADILENAALVLQKLGYESINAACVCGAESVNPKIQSTVDADELTKMQDRWAKYNMTVYGPVGLDLAISEEACHHKNYTVPGGGKADIVLVPTYEVGNVLGKSLSILAGAKNAGVIVGAKVPVVLVSRSDDAETKLASIALATLVSGV